MWRAILFGFGALLVGAGVAGIVLGLFRIFADGDLMHGLGNIIVGGFVAVTGVGNIREAL